MFFARQVGDLAIVWTQNPVRLPPDSEPQPDVALIKPSPDRYRAALPTAADVLLVIEVADTTVEYDREIKLPLYARHSIPEVWLIDLKAGTFEVYRDPTAQGYRTLLKPERGGTITPVLSVTCNCRSVRSGLSSGPNVVHSRYANRFDRCEEGCSNVAVPGMRPRFCSYISLQPERKLCEQCAISWCVPAAELTDATTLDIRKFIPEL